jgi:hypothetical protein
LSKRTISGQLNPLVRAVRVEGGLRVVDVGFDLVDGGDNGCLGEEDFEVLYRKVGYSM